MLDLIAIVLLLGWAFGFFAFGEAVGVFIHILLILAIITILYRIIKGKPIVK